MKQNLDENKLFRYKIYDWLIGLCLTSSEHYFSYIQDENIKKI
jgi:hypothetical protein